MAQIEGTRGRIIGGRYRLGAMLGRGGMGTVWRAVDEMLHRDVAIKELRLPDHLDDEEKDIARERTLREARTAARIGHPNVVTIHDVVEDGGIPWIVMELVEAPSLADILKTQGTLTPADAAELGLKVLEALLAADAKGVLHRDVKPANILVTAHGRVVLTDFGIATATGTATLTMTGMLVGSPDFLAPERAEGKRPGLAADLWSLAVVLYMTVEGRNPFRRGTMISTLNAILNDEVDPPRHAAGLGPVIAGWLVKDADTRMGAEEGARLLREVADSTPSRQYGAVPPPTPTPSPYGADTPPTGGGAPAPVGPYDPHEHAAPGHDSGASRHPGIGTPPRAWPQPEYPPSNATLPDKSVVGGPLQNAPTLTPDRTPQPRTGGAGRVIAVVVLVIALIVGGVVVGIVVAERQDAKNSAQTPGGGGTPATNAPSTAPKTSSKSPTTASGSAADRPATPPAGYELVEDPEGFTLFLPTNSTRSVVGDANDQIKYMTPDRKTSFLIGLTSVDNDPYGNLKKLAADKSAKPNYEMRQLRPYTPLPVGTSDAALWEFTWDGDPIDGDAGRSIPSHGINLGIVADRKDFALYAASSETNWPMTQKRFDVMVDSFRAR